MIYTVELPLPPKACSPNNSDPQLWKAGPKKKYRARCALLYRAARIPPLSGLVTVHADFYMAPSVVNGHRLPERCCRPMDKDNAVGCCKQALDALKDAGVIVNDTRRYLDIGKIGLHRRAKEHGGRRCLVMTLEVGK